VAVNGNLESNSANALRSAAVQGQGLAMMPSFLVAEEIRAGRLVPVLTQHSRAEYPINAVYPHRHQLSAKVRSFLELMTRIYHDNPDWADPCGAHIKACKPIDAMDVEMPVQRDAAPIPSSNAAVG
jgi:hypothetical protein